MYIGMQTVAYYRSNPQAVTVAIFPMGSPEICLHRFYAGHFLSVAYVCTIWLHQLDVGDQIFLSMFMNDTFNLLLLAIIHILASYTLKLPRTHERSSYAYCCCSAQIFAVRG